MNIGAVHAELEKIKSSSPDIEAVAVVNFDGLIIDDILPSNLDESRVGAMIASILTLGERVSAEMKKGDLEQVLVKGKHGYVILGSAGAEAVIAVSCNSQVKLGLIFLELKRAGQAIAPAILQS
ncbi:Roadblock/LC7 family protein [Chloroherpeton thalassium ATCC 35110]|uniref:Roadblock/LC7 family protein n=1 Tax=Chloroherpeton thalassium (strain ATCC 35110 / GB-78) TaxID=517418 RepID=B3QVU2_CHLT3|nr:roadblock/LC7 domain-containing protein [Chloroherpeton thalassium]ACF13149.1 Roadblock/LC7 family protein [Chloroherpeton thalassium ATCC 35110]